MLSKLNIAIPEIAICVSRLDTQGQISLYSSTSEASSYHLMQKARRSKTACKISEKRRGK
jgi:hypothetical protein